ncbi:MAG: hypothetical protein GY754_13510 [bacterium]|nr:hypothetical protein [bacterium]
MASIKSIKSIFSFVILSVFLFAGCGDITTLADDIPDAENLFFTSDGRLFITGSEHIYEYTESEGAKVVYNTPKAEFGGMAQYGDSLYAVRMTVQFDLCQQIDLVEMINQGLVPYLYNMLSDIIIEKELVRADLTESTLSFKPVYVLRDMFMPNGMVADDSGNLYIADETIVSLGQIVKVNVSGDTITQETWLSTDDGLSSPNGMAVRGNTIYFTDFKMSSAKAMVKKVNIIDGFPGPVTTLYTKTGFFDDLDAGSYRGIDGVVVADYAGRSLLLVKESGGLVTPIKEGELDYPSAVLIGRGSMFDSHELIVTEKGFIFEKNSNFGNKVILIEE